MLAHYLAVTLRNLRRAPGAAALNVVTLALGLVAMVSAYAYVAYLDRADRQFPNADRIHLLTMTYKPKQTVFTGVDRLNPQVPEAAAAYLREDFPNIEKIARAIVIDRRTMVASGEHAVRLLGVAVDPELVDIFGLRFAAGDAASALRAPDSVVLTAEYARKLFDDRDPVGEHVILQNAVDATVTGVLAPLPEPSHFGKNTPNARLAFDMLASMDLREKIVAATNGTQQDPLLVLENPADVAKVDGRALRLELARVPGVTGVTEMSYVPWEMLGVTAVNPTPDPMSPVRRVIMRNVGLDFFSVFGIDVLAGRAFEAADVITGAPPAADAPKLEPKIVIDRAFAAELGYATPAAAVGNAVYLLPSSGFNVKEPVTWRIVGVVENRSFSFQSFQNATSALYQVNAAPQFAVARISRNDVATALDGIDAMWRRLAPNPAINRRFLDDVFNQVYSSLARTNKLFGLLASMAFAISVAGLFGMATLVTARRRPEIAVRKTLGASTAQLLRLLLASFAKPVVLANVVAWPLGYSGASLYLDQFAKPIPVTPLPFVASLALTVAIAWLAVGSQTWRAARLKPADVLRHE